MIYLKRLLYSLCTSCKPNKSRTVRYAFPFAFITLAVAGAAVLTSQDTSYIRLSSTNSSVDAGDLFTINVYASAHTAVNAIDIAISFPESQVEIEGIDTGESVITLWTEEPYVEGNTVVLRGGTFRKGFLGEHLIAQINARAKQTGTAKFSVDQKTLLAGDGRGSSVSIEETGYESYTLYVNPEGTGDTSKLAGAVAVGIFTDVNGDGKVNMSDVMSFMAAWRSQSQSYDFNGDGRMTFVDFAIILADSFFK